MRISELKPDERPMERLLAHGAGCLSNAELLAILIRTGNTNKGALDIARELIDAAGGNLTDLGGMTIEQMCSVEGIGKGKALNIITALELGKRYIQESFLSQRQTICSAKDVFTLMLPRMKSLSHEEFWAIWLNASRQILGIEKLTSGGCSSTILDQKMIAKRALDKNAAGLVMIHNHPSGNPMPSSIDVQETAILKDNIGRFGIQIVDHIIMAEDCYYSFADNGITKPKIPKGK